MEAMMDANRIRAHMPVVCSNDRQFATVDHVEGSWIKLTRDDQGQHHWIPLSWVARVDQQVHVDRPGQQAMQEWQSSPPERAGAFSAQRGVGELGGSGG
jgi:hypothetical protein